MKENIGNLRKKIMLIESDINFLFTNVDKASDKAEELKVFAILQKRMHYIEGLNIERMN